MPTSCEPCPGKTSASTGALDLVLGLDLEHLAVAVVAAAAADAMRELRLPALRTRREIGGRQRVVRSARARLGLRQLFLWKRHRSFSSARRPFLSGLLRGPAPTPSSRQELSQTFEGATHVRALAATSPQVEVHTAAGAQTLAALGAARLHRPGRQQRLEQNGREI